MAITHVFLCPMLVTKGVTHFLKIFLYLIIDLLFFKVNGCGGALTALSGEITSPNYPGSYQSNRDCTWKIVVPPGSHIQLTFNV